MNTNFKILIGAGIGAAIGYFVGSVVVEIIAIKEHGPEDYDWLDGVENDPIEEKVDTKDMKKRTDEPVRKVIKRVRNYTQYFKEQGREDLVQLAAKYNGEESVEPLTGDEAKDHDIVMEELAEMDEEIQTVDPSIISMAEFANEDDGYETLTLNYYDDDVITDEHDNPIPNPEEILGNEALVSFGEMSGDEDVVYVKNEAKKAMYEVVRTNKEYGEQISQRRLEEKRRLRAARLAAKQKEEDHGEDNT